MSTTAVLFILSCFSSRYLWDIKKEGKGKNRGRVVFYNLEWLTNFDVQRAGVDERVSRANCLRLILLWMPDTNRYFFARQNSGFSPETRPLFPRSPAFFSPANPAFFLDYPGGLPRIMREFLRKNRGFPRIIREKTPGNPGRTLEFLGQKCRIFGQKKCFSPLFQSKSGP